MSILFAIYSDWALLIFRVAFGALLLAHGLPKLKDLKGTWGWFQSVGFKPGWLWGTVAGALETLGGLAIILGIGTRYVALLLAGQFLVILAWRLIRRDKFVGGWELDMMMFVSALVLATSGGGIYSGRNLLLLLI